MDPFENSQLKVVKVTVTIIDSHIVQTYNRITTTQLVIFPLGHRMSSFKRKAKGFFDSFILDLVDCENLTHFWLYTAQAIFMWAFDDPENGYMYCIEAVDQKRAAVGQATRFPSVPLVRSLWKENARDACRIKRWVSREGNYKVRNKNKIKNEKKRNDKKLKLVVSKIRSFQENNDHTYRCVE